MDRKEAVSIFLQRIIRGYRDDQYSKGIRASGASAASLKGEVTETGGNIFGSHYFAYQKVGRPKYGAPPNKFPPIEAIIQWLKDKTTFRIDEDRGISLRSLAFLIARKIAKHGTDIYRKKRPGLSIEERSLEARKELIKNLARIEKEKIIDSLKKLKPE